MRAVLATVLALGLSPVAAARTASQPLFEFGRVGGNIQPFTVTINADGTLDHSGAVQLAKPDTQLSEAKLAALLRYARTQGFWSLPRRTFCPDSLPDFASSFVTIHTGSTTRTVRVRGGCRPRFTRLYRALSAAATVTQ